jgi:hypothetical protein
MPHIYELPLGAGHQLHGGRFLDRVIGGWNTAGVVTAWSGLPLTVTQSAQVFGGATSTITANTAMVPTGSLASTGITSGSAGCTLTGVGSVGTTAAATGTGLNIFSDPCAVYGSFRYIQLTSDTRTGRANPLRGLPFYNMDMRLGKDTRISERKMLLFSAAFFNVFA